MHNRKKYFLNYFLHMLLIKRHICKYTVKMMISIAKGNKFEPNFTLDTFITNMNDFFKYGNLNDFPQNGPYEYNELIKYLKRIQKTIKSDCKKQKSFKNTYYIIEFSEVPIEDLLYQAAKDCGYYVVDEFIGDSYVYQIESIF